LSVAVLLSQIHDVTALDIIQKKADLINDRISPIKDDDISHYLKYKKLNLTATTNKKEAYKDADIIFICVPTDYDDVTENFNLSTITHVMCDIFENNHNAIICIKSTVPIGYTESLSNPKIVFSPEFSREGKALYDNLYPSRIIVGGDHHNSQIVADVLNECSLDIYPPVMITGASVAEAIKLFSNTYLALRIAFFNELDSYCIAQGLSAEKIIKGMSFDNRVGNYYNNPSFGYGGYCLPKDSKQLLSNFYDIPQNIISAIVESNKTRKDFIVTEIIKRNPETVGIYRLSMKEGSDNCRESATIDIIIELELQNIKYIIYEPNLNNKMTLKEFKEKADLIIANRNHKDLEDVQYKVFTRDIFRRD